MAEIVSLKWLGPLFKKLTRIRGERAEELRQLSEDTLNSVTR